jgi:glutaredoxin
MKAQVTLYSQPGCHLCEEMKLEIARANCAEVFELEEVNIESDPELWTRYRFDIPVLLIDGVEMFRHRLTSAAFRERIFSRTRMRCD